jgi:hypothetical protein
VCHPESGPDGLGRERGCVPFASRWSVPGRDLLLIFLQPPDSNRLIGKVLPRQETIVKSLMDALKSRELDSLTRLCRKVCGHGVLPYWFEVMRQGHGYEESGEAEESE